MVDEYLMNKQCTENILTKQGKKPERIALMALKVLRNKGYRSIIQI